MEINLKDYTFLNNKISVNIPSNTIVGVVGSARDKFISCLCLNTLEKGSFLIEDNKVTKDNIKVFRKRIGYVSKYFSKSYYYFTVEEYLLNEIKLRELSFCDLSKKLRDCLKIVGLDKSFLDRNIKDLSTVERKLVMLASVLILNPSVFILDEPFLGIDVINEKKIMRLLLKIQEKYKKTLILVTEDTEYIYQYTKEVIILNESGLLISGLTKEVFKEVELLQKNNILLPPILEFTYLARKKKKVKIDYHTDIRDIIKDIYKHV